MANEAKRTDEDVSPMAAQNTGPERTGPAKEPLRWEEPSVRGKESDRDGAEMPKGGESATRDDL